MNTTEATAWTVTNDSCSFSCREDKMRADMHACACMGVVDDWNDNESVRVGGFP